MRYCSWSLNKKFSAAFPLLLVLSLAFSCNNIYFLIPIDKSTTFFFFTLGFPIILLIIIKIQMITTQFILSRKLQTLELKRLFPLILGLPFFGSPQQHGAKTSQELRIYSQKRKNKFLSSLSWFFFFFSSYYSPKNISSLFVATKKHEREKERDFFLIPVKLRLNVAIHFLQLSPSFSLVVIILPLKNKAINLWEGDSLHFGVTHFHMFGRQVETKVTTLSNTSPLTFLLYTN